MCFISKEITDTFTTKNILEKVSSLFHGFRMGTFFEKKQIFCVYLYLLRLSSSFLGKLYFLCT